MKVYAVWRGSYEDAFIDVMFTTRELAEQYIDGNGAYRWEWNELVTMAGKEIPNAFWIRTERDKEGKVVKRWQEPKTYKHPGPFDDWVRGKDKGYIEEYEVLEGLP